MTILKKWQLLALLIANAIALNACNKSNATNNQSTVNSDIRQKTESNQQSAQKAVSDVRSELDKAKKARKAVFVIVTGTGTADTEKATAIAKGANGIYKNAVVVQMNRDDEANTPLVGQWRLAGAPLPLILVISPKGFTTGGYILSQATAQNVADLVPSPKLDDVYAAINNGKAAFLVISKKSYADKTEILKNCKTALTQLQNKAVIIEVDRNDAAEANFIKQLNLKDLPNTTSVLVINSSGQTTGTFDGTAGTNALVLAANKVVRSGGCCPGGSSSGAGCGTKK